jgi:hypothetical protein
MNIIDSSTVDIGKSNKLCVFINNGVGISVVNSDLMMKVSYNYNKKILVCHNNADNIWSNISNVVFRGAYISNSYYGIGARASVLSNYGSTGDDLTGKPPIIITNCTNGIITYNNSNLRLRNINISSCTNAGIYCTNSIFIIDLYPSDLTNNKNGIILDTCSGSISECTIFGISTTGYGIYTAFTTSFIHNSTVDNCSEGIHIDRGSYSYINNVSSINNDKFGVLLYHKSKAVIRNDSSYNISGNGSYNVYSQWGSSANIYTDNAISNMSPIQNTEPTWTGFNAGSFIGYTEY